MREMICGIMRDLKAEQMAYEKREKQVRLAGRYLQRAKLAGIIAKYELEPDEFYTAKQKAERYLKGEKHENNRSF